MNSSRTPSCKTLVAEQATQGVRTINTESNASEDTDKSPTSPHISRRQENTLCKGQRMRLLPSDSQKHVLTQWIGAGRFVWNWALQQQYEFYDTALLQEDKLNQQLMEEYESACLQEKQQHGDTASSKTNKKNTKSTLKKPTTVKLKKYLNGNDLLKQLTQLKKTEEFSWLEKVPSTVISRTFRHLDRAWSAFFDGLSGKRQDEPGKPVFRAYLGSNESACFQIDARHTCAFDADNHTLRIPGLGPVPVVVSENVTGDISQITVRRKGDQWYVSLSLINVKPNDIQRRNNNKNTVKTDCKHSNNKTVLSSHAGKNSAPSKVIAYPENPTDRLKNPHKLGVAALDASVVSGAVATTDGKTTFSLFNDNVLRSDQKHEEKLTKYQRVYSRKQEIRYNNAGIFRDDKGKWPKDVNKILAEKGIKKNSKRMEQVKDSIAVLKLHEVFRKHDAIHKFTTDIVRNNHTVVVETLMLHAMAQSKLGKRFRRRMHEACMGEIIRQLKYKCEWHNRSLIFVDKWFPSSKRCSNTACHEKNKYLLLKDREWLCTACNTKHIRDDTAAFNLWQEGWRLLEEFFQQNDTIGSMKKEPINMLAAGSVVRGSQGVVFEAVPLVKEKPKPTKSKAQKSHAVFSKQTA